MTMTESIILNIASNGPATTAQSASSQQSSHHLQAIQMAELQAPHISEPALDFDSQPTSSKDLFEMHISFSSTYFNALNKPEYGSFKGFIIKKDNNSEQSKDLDLSYAPTKGPMLAPFGLHGCICATIKDTFDLLGPSRKHMRTISHTIAVEREEIFEIRQKPSYKMNVISLTDPHNEPEEK
ncbi:hypothetical protein BGX26_012458 [Mortierella sp. AD094]|nr:hypothetical protein BGX26_012458 [Mortierella sp. AD094]